MEWTILGTEQEALSVNCCALLRCKLTNVPAYGIQNDLIITTWQK